MRTLFLPLALLCALPWTGGPAHACLTAAPFQVSDVQYADVVVVGRIVDYAMVLDPKIRAFHDLPLVDTPDLPPDLRRSFSFPPRFVSDYARFRVEVEEVLRGRAPRAFTATWDNSTFAEPETMEKGPYVIALRDPKSPIPPLNGPSATVLPAPEANVLTVLQAPCSSAFILPVESAEAAKIRELVGAR